MPRVPRAGGGPVISRVLPFALLLVGCVGQGHPLSPSEKVQCKFELIAEFVHAIPDDALFRALSGDDPAPLTAYLLKSMSPADVVSLINAWRECSGPTAETE